VSRIARPAAVTHRDVDDDARNGDRRGEGRDRKQQAVVGQYLDVRLCGHACAVC
jgi:hypothetical protein